MRRAKRRRTHQIELPDANNQQAAINVGERDIGNMCYNCEYCNASYWGHELNTSNKNTKFCDDGKVSLDPIFETPTLLRELLTGDTREANNYREHIRECNSAMAFASVGAEIRLWTEFHVLKLTRNKRTTGSEKEFSDWLFEVGDGRSDASISLLTSCFSSTQDPVEQLCCDININTVTARQLNGRAMLSVTNKDYLEMNKVLDHMPGEETIYKSVDTVANQEPSDHPAYPEEFLNSLIPTGMRPHELKLKVGAVIMLLRNLMPSLGLCSGTRLSIKRLQRHKVEACVIDVLNLDTVLIPRIPLIPSDTNMPFKFKRRQFPIRLAFSMTMNKSQGQTFDKICFSFRNLYSVMGNYVSLSQEFDHWAH
jgi:hypothetical protein